MTGKEIANNLRETTLNWGTGHLHSHSKQTYCVLGIKAAEKGVSVQTLHLFDEGECKKTYVDFGLSLLISMNDFSKSKEAFIEKLEAKYADAKWDVEDFVSYLLRVQARRKRKKK